MSTRGATLTELNVLGDQTAQTQAGQGASNSPNLSPNTGRARCAGFRRTLNRLPGELAWKLCTFDVEAQVQKYSEVLVSFGPAPSDLRNCQHIEFAIKLLILIYLLPQSTCQVVRDLDQHTSV